LNVAEARNALANQTGGEVAVLEEAVKTAVKQFRLLPSVASAEKAAVEKAKEELAAKATASAAAWSLAEKARLTRDELLVGTPSVDQVAEAESAHQKLLKGWAEAKLEEDDAIGTLSKAKGLLEDALDTLLKDLPVDIESAAGTTAVPVADFDYDTSSETNDDPDTADPNAAGLDQAVQKRAAVKAVADADRELKEAQTALEGLSGDTSMPMGNEATLRAEKRLVAAELAIEAAEKRFRLLPSVASEEKTAVEKAVHRMHTAQETSKEAQKAVDDATHARSDMTQENSTLEARNAAESGLLALTEANRIAVQEEKTVEFEFNTAKQALADAQKAALQTALKDLINDGGDSDDSDVPGLETDPLEDTPDASGSGGVSATPDAADAGVSGGGVPAAPPPSLFDPAGQFMLDAADAWGKQTATKKDALVSFGDAGDHMEINSNFKVADGRVQKSKNPARSAARELAIMLYAARDCIDTSGTGENPFRVLFGAGTVNTEYGTSKWRSDRALWDGYTLPTLQDPHVVTLLQTVHEANVIAHSDNSSKDAFVLNWAQGLARRAQTVFVEEPMTDVGAIMNVMEKKDAGAAREPMDSQPGLSFVVEELDMFDEFLTDWP
jgi:hypothetical protein